VARRAVRAKQGPAFSDLGRACGVRFADGTSPLLWQLGRGTHTETDASWKKYRRDQTDSPPFVGNDSQSEARAVRLFYYLTRAAEHQVDEDPNAAYGSGQPKRGTPAYSFYNVTDHNRGCYTRKIGYGVLDSDKHPSMARG